MDIGHQMIRAKWLLIAVVVFLISGCISFFEFQYFAFGQTATGDITSTQTLEGRRRRGWSRTKKLQVNFNYTEADGSQRKGVDTVDLDWPVPANRKVSIQYMPGPYGQSRIAGQVNWFILGLFAASLGAIVVFGYRFVREAKDELRESKRKKKRRREMED